VRSATEHRRVRNNPDGLFSGCLRAKTMVSTQKLKQSPGSNEYQREEPNFLDGLPLEEKFHEKLSNYLYFPNEISIITSLIHSNPIQNSLK
jgi:hypothetical protein